MLNDIRLSIKKSLWAFGVLNALITSGLIFAPSVFSEPKAKSRQQPQAQPRVSKIIVEIRNISGDKRLWEKMARNLFFLQEGQPFSPKKFQESIEALKLSGMFQTIHVPDPDWEKDEIVLRIQLAPFPRIKDIKIDGAFPVFEQDILKIMTLNVGDAFKEKKLPEQKKAISHLFKNEGYIAPAITFSAKKSLIDGNIILYISIIKGGFFSIQQVKIKGNETYTGARLKLKLNAWRSSLLVRGFSRFIQKELKEDVKTLIKFYRQKGFAEVVVNTEIEKNPETKEAVIFFNIKEGPKYLVEFEGNRAFPDRTLRKELVLFTEGNAKNFGLRKSKRNIITQYRKTGYLEAKIKTIEINIIKKKKLIRKVRIIIHEGTQSIVRSINIKGNDKVNKKEIKKQILTQSRGKFSGGEFIPKTLEEDVIAIKSLYLKHGFREAKVREKILWHEDKKENKKYGEIEFLIIEGALSRVSKLKIEGLKVLTLEEAKKNLALRPGEVFRKYMIQSDENALATLISEKGYPHVKVKGKAVFPKDEEEAEVTYTVEEGPYVLMGDFFFAGNFKTREKVFEGEREIQQGDPFSLTKLLQTQRNILNLKAIKSARFKVIGLKEKAEKVNVIAQVEEEKPYFFELALGYDTERKSFINTRGGNRNLMGLNKSLEAGLDVSQIGYRGELDITQPKLFGLRLNSTFTLFAEKREELNQDFGTTSFGTRLGLSKKVLDNFSVNTNFRYEFRKQFKLGDKPIAPGDLEEFEPRNILAATPSLIYNSTDSHTRPKKGIYSSITVDISKGIEKFLDDFTRVRFEARTYYAPLERLTIAVRGRVGLIQPYGMNEDIPEDQLFFLGGSSDVRGYSENALHFDAAGDPVGGRGEILGSLEARVDVGYNFEMTLFYDTGSIRNGSDNIATDDFRSSYGAGLSYLTPIGPMGLLYGRKLDKRKNESPGRLHFSLGYTF